MNAQEFNTKLQQLDPRLYVDLSNTHYNTNSELGSCGIYLKSPTQTFQEYDFNHKYLTWCTVKHIPEGTQYNKDRTVAANGLRELLNTIAEHIPVSKDRIERQFGIGGLGWYDYDKLTAEQKFVKQYPDKKRDIPKVEDHLEQ